MTQMASRVLPILCPSRISLQAIQNLPLRATLRLRQWPRLRLWQLSNHRHHYLRRTSLNAHLPLTLNTPNRLLRVKRPTSSGRSPRRRRHLHNQISDRTLIFVPDVRPTPRRLRREGFNTNLCTNRLVQTGPAVFNGRSFVVSPNHLCSLSKFCVI